MDRDVIHGYEADASKLISKFEAILPSTLFAPVAHLLPQGSCKVIDIGAGTGAAAAWFAAKGQQVLAVEPVAAFRKAGNKAHKSSNIEWLDDYLPDLVATLERREMFDVVLLSAVWHHLNAEQRQRALPNLRALMAPSGILIVSLRHGKGARTRPCYKTTPQKLVDLAKAKGLQPVLCQPAESVQSVNRAAGVTWTWLAFTKDATESE